MFSVTLALADWAIIGALFVFFWWNLKGEIKDVKGGLQAEIKGVKGGLQAEIKDVKGSLQAEIKDAKGGLQADIKDVKDDLKIIKDHLIGSAVRNFKTHDPEKL